MMQKITSAIELREAILQLEIKRAEEGKALHEQFKLVYESMKPINLIKNTFKEVAASPDLKDSLVNTSVGLTAGYISKKLFEGLSNNPIRKFAGSALQFGIMNIVAKNPEVVKSFGQKILKMIRSRPDDKESKNDNGETS